MLKRYERTVCLLCKAHVPKDKPAGKTTGLAKKSALPRSQEG